VFQLNVSRIPSDTDNGRARNVSARNWLISPQASGRSLVLTTYEPSKQNTELAGSQKFTEHPSHVTTGIVAKL